MCVCVCNVCVVTVCVQTGEYVTDEEEMLSPVFPNCVEDQSSPLPADPADLDPDRLALKYKEVCLPACLSACLSACFMVHHNMSVSLTCPSL